MNKKNFLLFAALVIAQTFFFVSCQKDDLNLDETDEIVYISEDTLSSGKGKATKGAFFRKKSSILFVGDDGDLNGGVVYRTLKVKNLKGTVMQEWMLEFLHSGAFNQHRCMSDDSLGTKYGFFYLWETNFGDMSQEELDYMIYNPVTEECETGFHIPTEKDIDTFNSIFSDISIVNDLLEMGVFPPIEMRQAYENIDLRTYIWVKSNMPTIAEGCGSAMVWPSKKGQKMAHIISNNPKEQCRVRLMRTLSKEQW